MSKLHHDIIERYPNYILEFTLVELNKNHYMFRIIDNNKILMTGTAIPLGTYDVQRNAMIWGDCSNTLDKTIVKEIRKIRTTLSNEIEQTSLDFSVITRVELDEMLLKMSKLLNSEILLDNYDVFYHVYLIKKILTDER